MDKIVVSVEDRTPMKIFIGFPKTMGRAACEVVDRYRELGFCVVTPDWSLSRAGNAERIKACELLACIISDTCGYHVACEAYLGLDDARWPKLIQLYNSAGISIPRKRWRSALAGVLGCSSWTSSHGLDDRTYTLFLDLLDSRDRQAGRCFAGLDQAVINCEVDLLE